jgi:hypothetical protein
VIYPGGRDERAKALAGGFIELGNLFVAGGVLTPLFERGVVDLVWVVGGLLGGAAFYVAGLEEITP